MECNTYDYVIWVWFYKRFTTHSCLPPTIKRFPFDDVVMFNRCYTEPPLKLAYEWVNYISHKTKGVITIPCPAQARDWS